MSENPGKVLSLQEAVRRYVKPGIKLHLAAGIGGPSAAICEIIRQFWGKSPEFTLIQSTVTGHALNDLHDASMSEHDLDAWIKEWIIDCANHENYLSKIGEKRITALKEQSERSKHDAVSKPSPDLESGAGFEPKEMMLIALAREITRSAEKHGHKMILAGAGAAASASFLAYYQLKSAGCEIELATGNGQIGYTPAPGESILASEAGVRSSKMLTDTIMMQGVFVGGENNKCLSILGAGQMDKHGNINSTRSSKSKFLVGSGGANDALNAREVIVCLDQSKDRFVEKLAYVTGRGEAVTTVVSTMGIFKKPSPKEELHLVACLPTLLGYSLEERIKEIQNHCGWDLKVGPDVTEAPQPSQEELRLLRWLLSNE